MKDSMYLINLYLKFLDKKEEYEKVYHKPFNVLEELQNNLSSLSLNELIELYQKYATNINIQREKTPIEIFDLLYQIIIIQLNEVSLMKEIDLYADFFNKILDFEETINTYQNIVSAKSFYANDEYYIERQISKEKLSKEELLKQKRGELEYYIQILTTLEKSYNILDKLQDAILVNIESRIDRSKEDENSHLLETINNRIEKNSKEILRRKELQANKKALSIQSRFNNTSMYEILSGLEVTSLKNKNYVYESYKETLMEKVKQNNQK